MGDVSRTTSRPRIVAPVCSVEEFLNAVRAGADEVYCGVIPQEVGDRFGYDDMVSRRQGHVTNVTKVSILEELAAQSAIHNTPVTLALNSYYSRAIRPEMLDLAVKWADCGGGHIVLCDIGLLLALRQRELPLNYHLSIMAGVFNRQAIDFFVSLGVSRVVLDRTFRLSELEGLIEPFADIEFEALVLHDRCLFIDAFCGFYHGTSFLPGTVTAVPWERCSYSGTLRILAHDLGYTGHGCDFVLKGMSRYTSVCRQDQARFTPECAACQLRVITDAGIHFLKIAGRGLPSAVKAKSVAFVRKALDLLWDDEKENVDKVSMLRSLYQRSFGTTCKQQKCYYKE
jgi:U32 family peptidase